MDHRRWVGLLCAVLLLPASDVAAGLRNPIGGAGDLQFFADIAVFPTSTGARADLAVALHNPQLHFEPEKGGGMTAVLKVRLKLARHGFVAADTSQIYALQATSPEDATDAERYQVVELSIPVNAGLWAATVEVTDLQRHPEGVLTGSATGRGTAVLAAPGWAGLAADAPPDMRATPDAPMPRVSDPEFRIASGRGESLPHPERVYGLVADTLQVYLQADRIPPGEAASIEVEVHDPLSGSRGKDLIVLRPQDAMGGDAAAIYRLPIDSFLEGAYVLRCTPSWDDSAATEAEFNVSWRMETVAIGGRDVRLEAEILLNSKEAAQFEKASPAAQLRTVQARWDALDPTPGTAENEVYDEFLARAAYAKRYFGQQFTSGSRTDRGRTYIRYGAPAEVTLEVIPYNADDLDDAIVSVHEVLQTERQGAQIKQAVPDPPAGIQAQRDRAINETRVNTQGAAFELWRYQLMGKPLIPQRVLAENVHLRFLFVDRLGTGEYRLEFTNVSEAR